MKITGLSFLTVVLFSLLPVCAAAGSKSKDFPVPADVLFNSAVTAAGNYDLTNFDASHLRFSFNVSGRIVAWLLAVDASVESLTEKSSRLVLVISTPNPRDWVSWGTSGRMANEFFRYVENAIASWKLVQYRLTLLKPAEGGVPSYSDDTISVEFQFPCTSIDFRLTNKTEGPLTIDWNQWSYIDTENRSHKVAYRRSLYKGKEFSVSPSIVPPTAVMAESLVPTDYVEWNDVAGGFRTHDLFPCTYASVGQYVGKTVSVFTPVEVNGNVKNYTFSFNIQGVRLESR